MIHMQTSMDHEVLRRVSFLIGDANIIGSMNNLPSRVPFDDEIVEFLNDVSRILMNNKQTRQYSDVTTFAFWLRKGSVGKLKDRFYPNDSRYLLGKGVAFHIAPSNVPVNFAYSLAVGLLCGNANVVRVPSRDFEQVSLIVDAFSEALDEHSDMKPYIMLVQYDRDREINDLFSSMADMRVVWGGDRTIEEIRKSPLHPRSGEITFADRYSLAVIDSDTYLGMSDKAKIAQEFYNDTFFSDQNACTSPRIVIWVGNNIEAAKELFWEEEHKLVSQKYKFQDIQAVNKLTSAYLVAEAISGCRVEAHEDNLIIRIHIPSIAPSLMEYRDNSGFFFEYECEDIMRIRDICNDKHCQTIAYIGDKNMFTPLIQSGIKGVDRIVPIGKTMDFDLIWDGYNLVEMLTRQISVL